MSITINTSLEQKVTELEQKAERVKGAQNTEKKVEATGSSLRRLTHKLESIDDVASELAFYVGILEEVFDGSRPHEVDSAIADATAAVDLEDERLLEAADEQRFTDIDRQLDEAKDGLTSAIVDVKECINEEQSIWLDKLSDARELNRLIGGRNDGFQELIDELSTFLNQTSWNTNEQPTALAAKWDRLVDRWNRNTGKHGWETFKEEHGLSQQTIDELEQFSSDGSVPAVDISVQTYQELKDVPDLEAAFQFELRKR